MRLDCTMKLYAIRKKFDSITSQPVALAALKQSNRRKSSLECDVVRNEVASSLNLRVTRNHHLILGQITQKLSTIRP